MNCTEHYVKGNQMDNKIISFLDKVPYEQRLRMMGLDALYTELRKWKEASDSCNDRGFAEHSQKILFMISQSYCFIIDNLLEELEKLKLEVSEKGGEEKNGQ